MQMSAIDPISTARELATHANDIEHLQSDMDKMVAEMAEVRKALQSIQTTLSEAKGGWKVLMMIGGGAGVLGAAITHAVHYFLGK
jgi:prefoldin subunit 5